MKLSKNLPLRLLMSEMGLQMKDVAKRARMTPTSLSRMLASDMTTAQTTRVLTACRDLIREQECGSDGED